MTALEKILGYEFKDKSLLEQALTHSSITTDISKNYERLEFLGDRVLGVAMAHLLYKIFPNEPEGSLSPRHVRLVRKETVSAVARKLHLDKYIRAESTYLKRNTNVLCDVAEAVIGAICLDSGFETAIEFVDRNWQDLIVKSDKPPKDFKSALQEKTQEIFGGILPAYELIGKEGLEHQPCFSIKASIEGHEAIGKGQNKKMAEQEAAQKLLEILEEKFGQ